MGKHAFGRYTANTTVRERLCVRFTATSTGTKVVKVTFHRNYLSSSGTPVVPMKEGETTLPSLADRISVPFVLAARPFTPLADGNAWWQRLVQGIGLQVGLTVEHYRTSLNDETTAGLHAALSLDIPLYGGPQTGGIALRGYARMLATPEILLERESTQMVYVGYVTSQIYMGLCWTP